VLTIFFFSSRRRHTRSKRDWSSDVCSSDLFHTRFGHRTRQNCLTVFFPPDVANKTLHYLFADTNAFDFCQIGVLPSARASDETHVVIIMTTTELVKKYRP